MPFWLLVFFQVLAALLPVSFSPSAMAGEALLRWEANSEPDLSGYRVYYSKTPGYHEAFLEAGLTQDPSFPEYRITGLSEGATYYFSITAYDVFGNESAHSHEVEKLIPVSTDIGSPSPTDDPSETPADTSPVSAAVKNKPPTSVTGPTQIVEPAGPVILDGSASHDQDQDPLEYDWIQTAGDPVVLVSANSSRPQFSPPATGLYSFELVVSDDYSSSAPDSVNIHVVDRIFAQGIMEPGVGGSLIALDDPMGGVRLDVPTGALPGETPVAIARNLDVPPPSGKNLILEPVALEPDGLAVNQPVLVTLPYDAGRFDGADSLEAYRFDSTVGEWIPVPFATVDREGDYVAIELDRLSPVALAVREGASSSHDASGGYGCGFIRNSGRMPPPPFPRPVDLAFPLLILIGLALRKALFPTETVLPKGKPT